MKEPHFKNLDEGVEDPGLTHAERRAVLFFEEFWPLCIFTVLFVLMCSLPLILSGYFSTLNRFSSSDVVWPAYGLLIMLAYLVALGVTFVMPRIMGWYLLLLTILALISAEHGKAWQVGPSIGTIFILYVLVAIFTLPQREEKNTAGH